MQAGCGAELLLAFGEICGMKTAKYVNGTWNVVGVG